MYTHDGLLLEENVPAPGIPSATTTFNTRPTMYGDDVIYWIAGLNFTGGTSSEERVLYTYQSGVFTPIYRSGQHMVAGFIIDRLDFDYDVSDSDNNLIQLLEGDTGSGTDDGFMVVNGSTLIARESFPSNIPSHNWDNFDLMGINNNGDFVFSGDTDGLTTEDEFVALNGNIVIQEGGVLDGVSLIGFNVGGLSIDNNGRVGIIAFADGKEHFFLSDISDLVGNAELILSVDDSLDSDNDGVGDYSIVDINTFGASFELSDDKNVFLELEILPTGATVDVDAIVKISTSSCTVATVDLLNGVDDIAPSAIEYIEADVINASNVIGANANVGYDATLEVNLMPDFEVILGALFEARIDGCGGLTGPIN